MPKLNMKRDAVYVYVSYVLRYLSLLFLIPYYSRVLGAESYGQLLTAMSLMGIIWMIVNYGFSPIGAREIAKAKEQGDINNIFSRQLLSRVVLVPVGILVGVGGTIFSPILASNPLLGVLATVLGILSAFNFGWLFQGLRQFKRNMVIEAIAYPINVILVISLVRGEQDTVFAMLSLTISTAICLSLATFFAAKTARFCRQKTATIILEIKETSIMFLQNINTRIMTSGSILLLGFLTTPDHVGFFGASERILAFGIAFLLPMAQYLMPTISNKMISDPESIPKLVRTGFYIELGYGVFALLGGVILSPFIFPILLGEGFSSSILIFQILVCSMPFLAFSHAAANYILIPQKKEKWYLYAVLIGNIFNIVIALIAAQIWGAIGMAVARVVGEIVIAVSLTFFMMRLNMFHEFMEPRWLKSK